MPGLKGPQVAIVQNETELPEYPDYNASQAIGFRSVYVEVTDGDFSIRITLPDWMPLLGNFIIASISFDGKPPQVQDQILGPPGHPTIISGPPYRVLLYPFRFTPLIRTPAGRDLSDDPSETFGSIIVRLKHAKYIHGLPFSPSEHPTVVLPPAVTDKAMRDRYLSYGVSVGPGIPTDKPDQGVPPYEIVGGAKDCYTFQFKYRSRQALHEFGLILDPNPTQGAGEVQDPFDPAWAELGVP
ncbi:hypothetical protein PRZ48_012069 [Zasmidium cellare]|uniref:DUF7918 domain-containing protein n=1 Tax=Zasmidium cellare TaxID=395010 RepID=A0ABR0E499_ZASCE|nr:hypothetical protein PRZ48_012069 [Zasmidium cellare]